MTQADSVHSTPIADPPLDNAKPSRRAIVAGFAASALAAAPSAAAAGSHPDRELIALGARYFELEAQVDAAYEHHDKCCHACVFPDRPDVLRHQMDDHVFGLQLPLLGDNHRAAISSDTKLNQFYNADEIKRVRFAPPPFDPELIPVQQARIAEIELAWAKWQDACSTAAKASGLDVAQVEIDDRVNEQQEVAAVIAEHSARTVAGLRVRALILSNKGMPYSDGEEGDGSTVDLMERAIVRDLLAMADNGLMV